MSNEERKDLLDEANELGLEFAKNISTGKLQEMINESKGPAVKEDAPEPKEEDTTKPYNSVVDKATLRRKFIADRKAKAMATRVVTITNKDNRDNDFTTTAPLSFENQHFGVSKKVPLDVPVELEQAVIDIAESASIPHHKDEVGDGRRTGNKVTVLVKRYVVSYAKS